MGNLPVFFEYIETRCITFYYSLDKQFLFLYSYNCQIVVSFAQVNIKQKRLLLHVIFHNIYSVIQSRWTHSDEHIQSRWKTLSISNIRIIAGLFSLTFPITLAINNKNLGIPCFFF